MAGLRVTFDPEADAAYVYLRRRIGPGEVGRTIEAEGMPCTIVLDFCAGTASSASRSSAPRAICRLSS